jgi:hypothetical protein
LVIAFFRFTTGTFFKKQKEKLVYGLVMLFVYLVSPHSHFTDCDLPQGHRDENNFECRTQKTHHLRDYKQANR